MMSLLTTAVLLLTLQGAAPPIDSKPPPKVWTLAQAAYRQVASEGRVKNQLLTVIDYSLPSTQKRLWVVEPRSGRTLFHELVAHGRNSGHNHALAFGNERGSLRSSVGVFLTGERYRGKHGVSLRLDGLEPGINDLARPRAVVIHPADYVSPQFARQHGRLGRSHGCPAVTPEVAGQLIETIEGQSVLFIYGEDPQWLKTSRYLRASATPASQMKE